MKHLVAVAEKKSTESVDRKTLHPKSQLLQKRDSGYNSPVTPGTTPENTKTMKSLHLGAQTQRSNSSPAAVSEGSDMQKVVQSPKNQLPSGKNGVLKRQLSSPGALDASQTAEVSENTAR